MKAIKISEKTRSRHFQGFIFDRIPVRDGRGQLQSTWVLGVCSSFQFKDEVKAFCRAHGGAWESIEKYWFIPVAGATVKEILPNLWAMMELAAEEIGHALPESLEFSLEANLGQHTEISMNWLQKKARASVG